MKSKQRRAERRELLRENQRSIERARSTTYQRRIRLAKIEKAETLREYPILARILFRGGRVR